MNSRRHTSPDIQKFRWLVRSRCLVLFGALLLWSAAAFAQPLPTRFAIVGDFGANLAAEGDVANLIKSWNVDFVITTGDNNYPYGQASTIDANIGQYYHDFISPYLGNYGAGADVNRFFPSLGNHDWGDGFIFPATVKPYTDYFNLPGNERYYDFVRGPVHFFAVDSDEHEPDGRTPTSIQGAWLQNRLTGATEPWKIVYFHYPPYSSNPRGPITFMRWPFQQWGASAVLNGHDHAYERLIVNGLPYMINGLGGQAKDAFNTTPDPNSVVRYRDDWGAQLVTAYADSINFQMITRTGVLIDSYTLAATLPAAPTGLVTTPVSSTQAFVQWVDNASIETGFKVYRSTDGINFALAGTVGSNVTNYVDSGLSPQTTYYYKITAYNANGESVPTNVATVALPVSDGDAPSNLTAVLSSAGRVDLAWTDNSAIEDGFVIERSTDGTTYAQYGTAATNAMTYSDTAISPSTTYYYREFDEREYALAVAEHVGATSHLVFPTPEDFWSCFEKMAWHQDMPFGSFSFYAQWRVMRAAREAGVKVLLDGQGGDEVFGGYAKFRYAYLASLLRSRKFPRMVRELSATLRQGDRYVLNIRNGFRYLPRGMRSLLQVDSLLKQVLLTDWNAAVADESTPATRWWRNASGSGSGDPLTLMQRIQVDDIVMDTLPTLLRLEDRSSMAFSIEARVPLLDHRLVEYGVSLPDHLKVQNGWSKFAIRETMRGLVPEKVRLRKSKLGFAAPQREWLTDHLQEPIRALIHDDLRSADYIDPAALRRWYSSPQASRANTESYLGLFRLLSLEMWMRAFEIPQRGPERRLSARAAAMTHA